jgi:hypothetical protein
MSKADEVKALAGQISDDIAKPRRSRARKAAAPVDTKPVNYTCVEVYEPRRTSTYPQVYDPEGEWCGYFIDERAAKDWIKKQGDGYTMNYLSPPRKVRVLNDHDI